MNPKLKLLILCVLNVCFAAKRLGIRASVYLLAYFTALNVLAENKTVTTGTVVESGSTYTAAGGAAALTVTGSETLYAGADLTLSSTFGTGAATQRRAVTLDNQATLTLTDSVITTTGSVDGYAISADHASTLTVTGGQLTTSSTWGFVILADGASKVTVNHANITTSGYGGYGLYLRGTSTLTLSGGTISTTGYWGRGLNLRDHTVASVSQLQITTADNLAYAVNLEEETAATLDQLTISTTGAWSRGVYAKTSSTFTLTDSAINTTGSGAYGVHLDASTGTLRNNHLTTAGYVTHGIYTTATSALTVTGGTVSTSGNGAVGLYLSQQSAATVTDLTITTRGNNSAEGIHVTSTSALTLTGGTINTGGANSLGVYLNTFSTAVLNQINITTSSSSGQGVVANNNSTFTVNGGAITTGDIFGFGVVTARASIGEVNQLNITTTGTSGNGVYAQYSSTLTVNGGTVTTSGLRAHGAAVGYDPGNLLVLNNVYITTSGTVASGLNMSPRSLLSGTNTVVINGGVMHSAQEAAISINQDTSALTNDYTPDGTMGGAITQNVIITGGAELDGPVALAVGSVFTATDASGNHVQLDVPTAANLSVSQNSTLTGSVTVKDSAAATLTLSDRATLTGDVTAGDTATLDLTVSGPGSSFTGDIAQHDHAAVTVILDEEATGRGGFAGGNLITANDSAWTFTKDSRGNHGENHSVWNLGDYNVIFDNLTHTGTLNLSVNSDTGAGGSITITNTADGDGRVHIDTTGNGQADPNKVLPGKVTGNGTEHWQWDPINWGIDQLIKDGDHFIKNGVSPAGAVLNSSVATQQAMWFAQQNSLLKRMGDLRYGARASRPLADKDVRVPYHSLIENIWLRSYGQQLNVGSQVAGKAYEQLIYGVDLGTDHKFTLNADSDLYLGIYAGYGRSDIDYRTPGADGEINSYYGGLYATWLHSSGFYIDATFKAASVDNDLKAPYSGTQLTANYSDINLGGSLEIGKKFTFKDDWFIEPQFQVNYLHILAENYTAGPLTISAQDLDALQLRLGSLFGRTINLTNGGVLQPYVKISGVETISSGGAIRNGYQSTRVNTDGARAELGGGLIWQLDADNQLHLDYEASFGDKYDKPWGLTAGYRHQF